MIQWGKEEQSFLRILNVMWQHQPLDRWRP